MAVFDYVAFAAMAIVFVAMIWLLIFVGDLPANVAKERNHPQVAAIAAYGQTLLNAFQEVENALANEPLFARREEYLEQAVNDNERAFSKAQAQFNVGRVDLLSVLQIQARVLAARSALIAVRNERLAQRVNLHLALGGSFELRETEEAKDL